MVDPHVWERTVYLHTVAQRAFLQCETLARHRGAQYCVIKGATVAKIFQADFAVKTFRSNSSSGYIAGARVHVSQLRLVKTVDSCCLCERTCTRSSCRNSLLTPRIWREEPINVFQYTARRTGATGRSPSNITFQRASTTARVSTAKPRNIYKLRLSSVGRSMYTTEGVCG